MPGVVAHAFNPSTGEADAGGFLSSRTARATQRNPVSNPPPPKKKEFTHIYLKKHLPKKPYACKKWLLFESYLFNNVFKQTAV
jgi:hypothetical protein